MNEKFITAGIGIAFGIALAIGFFIFISRPKAPPPPQPTPISQNPPAPQTVNPLTIDSPSDGDIVTASPLIVSGLTSPKATVVVTGPADEQMVLADDKGQFMVKLKLEEGENTIVAAVVDERGTLQTDKKQVVLEIKSQ